MPKLWVFGDSFSSSSTHNANTRVWTRALKEKLCAEELMNVSLSGASQDWIIRQFLGATSQISSNDYVVVLFTHPNRFWFVEDRPDLTNPAILDFNQQLDPITAKAAESYFAYIQRPELDLQFTFYRALTVSHECQRLGLGRPLMIKCFPQEVSIAEKFDSLVWANGSLSEVQFNEYQNLDQVLEEIQHTGKDSIFDGTDCRYNHLCLVNHDRLVNKLADYFLNGTPVDLTQGFETKLLTKFWINNRELVAEMNPSAVELFRKKINPSRIFGGWN